MTNHLGAIVLCGGQSRRMGRSKAFLPFGDDLLLPRVVRRLMPVAKRIVVVRAKGQTIPALPEDVIITEDAREDRGPLQGIASGLFVLKEIVDVVFVSSTDAPFVDATLVQYLEKCRTAVDDLVVPRAFGKRHPLAALYVPRVLDEIERMLEANQLRVMDLLARVRTREVDENELRTLDDRLRFLSNVNTQADYEAALAEDIDR